MWSRDRILSIKKSHSILCSILFLSLIFICTYLANLKLFEISLSEFGISEPTRNIWNPILFLIGILLFIDSVQNIIRHFGGINFLIYIFGFSSLCLLITAVVSMEYYIHNITAFFYFIGFSFSIFMFGIKLIKTSLRIGMISISISILSVIVPTLMVYLIHGLAIPEIAHTMFIFLWSISMSYAKTIQDLLKKIGL